MVRTEVQKRETKGAKGREKMEKEEITQRKCTEPQTHAKIRGQGELGKKQSGAQKSMP